MSKTKKKATRIVLPAGRLVFPALQKPDTKFNALGEWKTDIAFDPNDSNVQAVVTQLEEILDTYKAAAIAENARLKSYSDKPVTAPEIDKDGNETGSVIIRAKQKCKVVSGGNNYEFDPPKIVDAKKKDVTKPVWGGTIAKVAVDVEGYAMASSRQFGVSLRLVAVQVLDLKTGEGSADVNDLFNSEEGYEDEGDPFTTESPTDGSSSDSNGDF